MGFGRGISPRLRGRSAFGGLSRRTRCRSRSTIRTGWSSASAWRITSGSPSACGIRSTGPGSDVFGSGTFDRPWLAAAADPMHAARAKLDAAFEFLAKLGVPFFCFHDRDIAPEGQTFAETKANLDAMIDATPSADGADRARSCCGAPPTCSAIRAMRRARRPTPIRRCSPTPPPRSRSMLEATHRLDGANYVLWGGREGYETLLNTDLAREEAQLARFLTLVADHKHRIGFKGTAPDRAQAAGADQAPVRLRRRDVHGFLARHGLASEYRLNLEVNHATLAGHSFHHEVAYAIANGIFGSIDANRGDYQNSWDTDQFPNSVDELSLALYEIVRGRRVHERRLQLRYQAAPPEHGPDRPVPCPHRRHRHAGASAARRGRARSSAVSSSDSASSAIRLGRRPRATILGGDADLEIA